jgi:hypothetical protein
VVICYDEAGQDHSQRLKGCGQYREFNDLLSRSADHYNKRRAHSSLNFLPPARREAISVRRSQHHPITRDQSDTAINGLSQDV